MAFADPQSVTINAIANSLARVPSAPNSGAFLKDDGLVGLNITQNMGKRNLGLSASTTRRLPLTPCLQESTSRLLCRSL